LSQGADYVDAASGMKLYDLDRIMVLEDSSAALELTDGCVYEMQASQMLTLQSGDTCETLAARASPQVDMTQIERSATSQIRPAAAAAAAPAEGFVLLGGSGTGTLLGMTPATAAVASIAAIGTVIALANGTGGDNRIETPQRSLSP
jgi:hypothetical protein